MTTFKEHRPTKPGDHRHWGQLHSAASSLAIAHSLQEKNQLILVLAKDSQTAAEMEREIQILGHTDVSVLSFPDWETLPYDHFSPHQDIVSQRLLTLYQLPSLKQGILIVPLTTALHRLPPDEFLQKYTLILDAGQTFDLDETRSRLEKAGYRCVDTVYEHGEFAVRGAIMDIFPMGSHTPFRIDLFDDEIDTIRTFDSDTQRSKDVVDQVRLLPAKEFPLDEDSIKGFKSRWRQKFDVDHRQCPLYKDISDGIAPPGTEYYLPLFYENTQTLFDYLPENTLIFTQPQLEDSLSQIWADISTRYNDRCHDIQRPILEPNAIFLEVDAFHGQLKHFPRITLSAETLQDKAGRTNFSFQVPPELPVDGKSDTPLVALESFMLEHAGYRFLFGAESTGRRESLLELLAKANIRPKTVNDWNEFLDSQEPVNIFVAPLERGILWDEQRVALIPESLLLGRRIMQRRRRKKAKDQSDQIIRNLTELRINAPVVHIDHGVGRYLGLQTLNLDGQDAEFLTLEYANSDKLYVPVSSLHLIARYSGADDDYAPLHKLGTDKWSIAKRKAAEKVRDTAAELLDIYARRAAKPGFKFRFDENSYQQFSDEFPFEETPDQQSAIDAVISDMRSPQAMDRLVCGDVGFGKTEVAMRAAFIAVQNEKQVAVLVPTTLLAQQHYQSFKDRFADWPVNIEVLSRFKTGKEQNAVIEGLESGNIDIVVGTHKLLQSKIDFKQLSLLIIDEEHRFGVQQKEKVKNLRSEIDILTLTATPIPRTLNMAMSGVRDLSIIATPPAKRLSVKTFVRVHDKPTIKEAILREILRGGQVYYLHNEVKSIEKTARDIEKLIPEARVVIGHGQMSERELEQVMSDFYHQKANVLVCTTIIETGIDIPNANTIVIDRADKFGLAQLHQLRGRVGRSHHQAYAYLMTAPKKTMTADAVKRLDAISAAEDLGAGFTLATHDLEIRGAGDLLGEEQSGQIHAIGFSLYMEMLEKAVEAIKAGKTPNADQPFDQGTEINMRIPALIPEDYLPDVHTRLTLYKRISSLKSTEDIKELQVEMIDRFGLLPNPVKNLFRIAELKLKLQPMGISKVDVGEEVGRLEFSTETTVDPFKLVKMVQAKPLTYSLEGGSQLKFKDNMLDTESRFKVVEQLTRELTA